MAEASSRSVRTPRAHEVVPSLEDDEDIPPLEDTPDDEVDFFFDEDDNGNDLPPLQEVSDDEGEDEENFRFYLAQMSGDADVQMGEEPQCEEDNAEGLLMNAASEGMEASDSADGFHRVHHATVTGSCQYLPFSYNLLTSPLRSAVRSQRQFTSTRSTTTAIT